MEIFVDKEIGVNLNTKQCFRKEIQNGPPLLLAQGAEGGVKRRQIQRPFHPRKYTFSVK
jgi:hypothetical protein